MTIAAVILAVDPGAALSYTVHGHPVTWARKRIDARRGKPRVYTDAKQDAAAKAHQWAAFDAMGGSKSTWSRDGAFAIEVRGYYASAVVGDADRLASLAMDALEGIAYTTDRQVRSVLAEVHADGTPERVEVRVARIAETVAPKRARKVAT